VKVEIMLMLTRLLRSLGQELVAARSSSTSRLSRLASTIISFLRA